MAEPATAAPRTRTGGRVPLNRERILRAALAFVDEHGLQALSMRKLAAGLGVEAMSLYNHIENKDEILAGIGDLVFAEVELPPAGAGNWTQLTRQVSHAARRALAGHPQVLPIIVAGPYRGAAFLRLMDSVVATLRVAGFDDDMAHHGWHSLASHVLGYVLQQTVTPALVAAAGAAPARSRDERARLAPREFPNIAAVAPYLDSCDPEDEFDFGVDVILTGLQAKLDAAPPARA